MSFLAVTDENYGPPLIEAFYWAVFDDGGSAQPAEWLHGRFWFIGTDVSMSHTRIAGYWPVPMCEPAKPTTGE